MLKKLLKLKSIIPLCIIILLLSSFYYFGLQKYFTFEQLRQDRETLLQLVSNYQVTSALIFIFSYALMTTLCLPLHFFFMTTSGFLFPFPLSLLYSLTGLTTGAFSLFLIAKTAISNVIRKNMPLFFHKISKEIEENKINYLLFLRLMPLIPSWIINLIPAFFSIPPFTYIWTTFIGSIPIALIYTYAGQELREIFNSDQSVYFQLILNTNMKLALLALALLSLFPIFIKHFSSKRKKKDSK